MNAKTCKQLRKSARLLAQANPQTENAQQYVEIEKNRKVMINAKGQPFLASAGTMINNPTSFRGIYRSLKNNFRKNVKV